MAASCGAMWPASTSPDWIGTGRVGMRSTRDGGGLMVTAVALISFAAHTAAQSPVPGPTIEVVAQDYRFVGLPTSVPAGSRVALINSGTEVHQIVVARRVD